jgi:hypothetical protein
LTFSTLNFGMYCANVLLPDLCGNYASNEGSANRWCSCRKNELYRLCFYPFLELIDNLDFVIFLGFREGWTSSNGRVKPVLNLKVCAHNCHEVWHVVTEASIDIFVKCLLCAFSPLEWHPFSHCFRSYVLLLQVYCLQVFDFLSRAGSVQFLPQRD